MPRELFTTVQSLTEDCGHFFRLNETGRSQFFSLPRSFSVFPPLSPFLYKCSLLLCLNVTVLSMLVKALLSSFPMSPSYGEWLSVMIGCLTTMFAQTFRSLYTKLWITFNKASSLHEIWAARLWLWRVQSKQCFSTTDSTPLCSALTTLATDAVFCSKWNPWPIFHETEWIFVILTT